MRIPLDLTKIIDKYNEKGVFIITNTTIYWCNGKTIIERYKHNFKKRIWNGFITSKGKIRIILEGDGVCYELNEFTNIWELFVEFEWKRKKNFYELVRDLQCNKHFLKIDYGFLDFDRHGNVYHYDKLIGNTTNPLYSTYFEYKKKRYLLTEEQLYILDTENNAISVVKEFNSKNYIMFKIKKELFIIQKSNSLLLKKDLKTDELIICSQLNNIKIIWEEIYSPVIIDF